MLVYQYKNTNRIYEFYTRRENNKRLESKTPTSCNIGNLILLETNLNQEADKSDYDKKKRIYKKSKEKWVLEFLDKNPSWDIGNFVERANELATIYYKEIFGKPVQVDNEVVKRH